MLVWNDVTAKWMETITIRQVEGLMLMNEFFIQFRARLPETIQFVANKVVYLYCAIHIMMRRIQPLMQYYLMYIFRREPLVHFRSLVPLNPGPTINWNEFVFLSFFLRHHIVIQSHIYTSVPASPATLIEYRVISVWTVYAHRHTQHGMLYSTVCKCRVVKCSVSPIGGNDGSESVNYISDLVLR